ncbi:hypothetical protein [Burkholderia pseudomallei]|uniref:hypothetical protein n=1 Tax=Burkholderia pseudomallei TaxID=28450 RepID=UPI00193D86B1|nr:hypothetical protein [Burkholderia pseudomallei]QRM23510.1 hypothetical protein JQX71_04295 [Burkholderia pseudomallei]
MAVQILEIESTTVAAGAQVVLDMHNNVPATVGVYPAVGATALVEYTLSPNDAIQKGTATWFAWTNGTVSTSTVNIFDGKVAAIRVTTTGGAVTVEVQK